MLAIGICHSVYPNDKISHLYYLFIYYYLIASANRIIEYRLCIHIPGVLIVVFKTIKKKHYLFCLKYLF